MREIVEISEKKLIERAINNDRIAQKTIFEKYYIAMYTSAYRILKKEELAYDAVQETFIKVFRYLHTHKYKASLYTWIKKILIRESIRLQTIEQKFELIKNEHFEDTIVWPDHILGESLNKAILQLPEGYRTVFSLIEIEGYTHKEVANMLNISEGTSKSQLYYAKKALQKSLIET